MGDYIEKMSVLSAIMQVEIEHPYYKNPKRPETYTDYNQGWADACNRIQSVVEFAIPSASVDSVIHVKWKYYHEQGIAVCTHCSFERKLGSDFGKAIACPNCGARMDLEDNK